MTREAKEPTAEERKGYHRMNTDGHSTKPKKPKPRFTATIPRRCPSRRFSVVASTEINNCVDDTSFYGPYAHLRETLDYDYHHNYKKERQWLQDSIVEEMLSTVKRLDANGICTTPTEPWIVFTAGAMGAGKGYAIRSLVRDGRFPLLAFVKVDPDEIARMLPEFTLYAEQCPDLAGELTKKEAGYVSEILILAALQAGKNVLVDGSLRDVNWYKGYFDRLRGEYSALRIAVMHVTAPRDIIFQRAADRAIETGRIVPTETLELALQQVPESVRVLGPLADYFCELNNVPGEQGIEIATNGETWESFQRQWLQTCTFLPSKRRYQKQLSMEETNEEKEELVFTAEEKKEASDAAIKAMGPPRRRLRSFSVLVSTEKNHYSSDMNFYGPYSHIRKTLDYNYHNNYTKERQWLQDAIINDMMSEAKITDVNGDVCTTPTEPWIVFTAGAMGAGKSHTIRKLVGKGRFPLVAFVKVDPDEARRHLPEFDLYVNQCPEMAGELTRKEAGYITEILTLAALQAGKNVLVDGSLRDSDWYQIYFARLRREYPILRIAILHVTAPRDAVFQRAADRAFQTGRMVPKETLEKALEQVPKSVKILAPLVDYYCQLDNKPNADDIELVKPDGETWETFQMRWMQTCAWVPRRRGKKLSQ